MKLFSADSRLFPTHGLRLLSNASVLIKRKISLIPARCLQTVAQIDTIKIMSGFIFVASVSQEDI